jgi:hypothetical protein
VQRTGQISAVPVPVYPVHSVSADDARPNTAWATPDGSTLASSANALDHPSSITLKILVKVSAPDPPRLSVEGLAAPVGYFGSFSMPKEWRLTRYCPSPSSHTRVGAKRRHDLGAKLAKDILMG